jgi:hypothetical protein
MKAAICRLGTTWMCLEQDDLLVTCAGPLAASSRSAHRDPRGVPPIGLLPDLFEVLNNKVATPGTCEVSRTALKSPTSAVAQGGRSEFRFQS